MPKADNRHMIFQGLKTYFGVLVQVFGGSNYQYQRQNSTRHKGEDQHARLEVDLEVGFHGTTQTITLQIPTLNAYGEAEIQRKTLEVKIPKGMKEGQQIRLSGQGQSGIQGGENGDLYIEIYYKDTETTRVEGVDVYHQLNISPWEAALGRSTHPPRYPMVGHYKFKFRKMPKRGSNSV